MGKMVWLFWLIYSNLTCPRLNKKANWHCNVKVYQQKGKKDKRSWVRTDDFKNQLGKHFKKGRRGEPLEVYIITIIIL